jgi:hypothetical protein
VFSLDGRGEYIHASASYDPKFGDTGPVYESTPLGARPIPVPAQDDFSYTLTATFNIWDNLLTRAEYRVDVLSSGSTAYRAISPGLPGAGSATVGPSSVQNEISLEAVYSF